MVTRTDVLAETIHESPLLISTFCIWCIFIYAIDPGRLIQYLFLNHKFLREDPHLLGVPPYYITSTCCRLSLQSHFPPTKL